jgi:P-type Ca2+ transporter type 2C
MSIVVPLLLLAVSWAPVETLFRFGPLPGDNLAISMGEAILLLLALDGLKRLWQTRLVQ